MQCAGNPRPVVSPKIPNRVLSCIKIAPLDLQCPNSHFLHAQVYEIPKLSYPAGKVNSHMGRPVKMRLLHTSVFRNTSPPFCPRNLASGLLPRSRITCKPVKGHLMKYFIKSPCQRSCSKAACSLLNTPTSSHLSKFVRSAEVKLFFAGSLQTLTPRKVGWSPQAVKPCSCG